MRFFRPIVIAIFLIITTIFVINWYRDKHVVQDASPVIEIDEELLKCSVQDDKSSFLAGVKASDKEDGDLTSKVIVESISKFVDKKKHICKITYAVEDSKHNVTKRTRKILFTDYKPPRFALSQPLCFDVGSDTTVVKVLSAEDDFDGDITNKIKILSNTTSTSTSGEYTVTAQVTNSFGDTTKFKSVVIIKSNNNLSPVINLKKNVVYLKVGDKFAPEDYIDSVKSHSKKTMDKSLVEVGNTNVNMKKAGYYSVQYVINSGEKDEGSAYMAVIVEDE